VIYHCNMFSFCETNSGQKSLWDRKKDPPGED
jgi:hypothetical protein